jgi:hypothetical protein
MDAELVLRAGTALCSAPPGVTPERGNPARGGAQPTRQWICSSPAKHHHLHKQARAQIGKSPSIQGMRGSGLVREGVFAGDVNPGIMQALSRASALLREAPFTARFITISFTNKPAPTTYSGSRHKSVGIGKSPNGSGRLARPAWN